MMTLDTAAQYLRQSRRSANEAQSRGMQEWATSFTKRAESLERIIERLRASEPSESGVVEGTR